MSRISSSCPVAGSPQILAVCTPEKSTRIASTPTISKKTHPKSNIKTSLIQGPKDLLESKKRKLKKNISGSSAESGSGSGLGGKQVKKPEPKSHVWPGLMQEPPFSFPRHKDQYRETKAKEAAGK